MNCPFVEVASLSAHASKLKIFGKCYLGKTTPSPPHFHPFPTRFSPARAKEVKRVEARVSIKFMSREALGEGLEAFINPWSTVELGKGFEIPYLGSRGGIHTLLSPLTSDAEARPGHFSLTYPFCPLPLFAPAGKRGEKIFLRRHRRSGLSSTQPKPPTSLESQQQPIENYFFISHSTRQASKSSKLRRPLPFQKCSRVSSGETKAARRSKG
jgi:hypothetical protein